MKMSCMGGLLRARPPPLIWALQSEPAVRTAEPLHETLQVSGAGAPQSSRPVVPPHAALPLSRTTDPYLRCALFLLDLNSVALIAVQKA